MFFFALSNVHKSFIFYAQIMLNKWLDKIKQTASATEREKNAEKFINQQ